KRNYDMLSEAVRLMGVVSGDAPSAASRPETPSEGDAGLRGRLKLAPTARDEEVRRTFQDEPAPVSAGRSRETDALSWKELLAGAGDPPEAETSEVQASGEDAEDLTRRLTGAILDLGVDPGALLPRARIEEAADA